MKDINIIKEYFFRLWDVILHKTPQWAIKELGKPHWGKGDSVARTATVAIYKNDKTLLNKCVQLLNEHKRWPDILCDPEIDLPNLFMEYLQVVILAYNKLAKKSFLPEIKWKKKYRCQWGITRDPFVMTLIAWYLLDGEGKCPVKVPWYIMRPDFYFFYKWIKTHQSKYKKKYERWMYSYLPMKKKIPIYVLHMHVWKAFVMESQSTMQLLHPFIPDWNYLLRVLSGHPLLYLQMDFIKRYRSRNHYHWGSDYWHEIGTNETVALPVDNIYRPDKEILEWALKHKML